MALDDEIAHAAPQVFVSKASEDADAVAQIVPMLQRAGLRPWVSERDIPSGADHATEVVAAIRASHVLLVLLSRRAMNSPWVLREVELAVSEEIPVVPVALPSFPGVEALPPSMSFRLASVQIQLDGDLPAAVRVCQRLAGARAQPSSLPVGHSAGRKPADRQPDRPTSEDVPGRPLRVATATPRGFVGDDRLSLLAELADRWSQVQVTGNPQVVVLLGETGFGKTRIVQELYRTIAQRQDPPAFWPAELTGSALTGQRALKESRKRVSPQRLAPPEGAGPEYLWLGHVVDEGHGSRVDLGLARLGDELARALGTAATLQPDGVAARMVQAGTGRVASGVDTEIAVAELLRRGTLTPDLLAVPGSAGAFWQGMRALWSDPDARLPAIVCIEDGHFAGQSTVSVFQQLATARDLPVLVVLCAQESRLGGRPAGEASGAASDDQQALREPLGALLDEGLAAVTVMRLARLPDVAVETLVLEALPDLGPDVVREVVIKVDGNPYHAHTLLVEMVRAAEQGRLTAGSVRERPGSFEDELRLQWAELPDDVRWLLSGIAVLGSQVPERIGLHAVASAVGPATASRPDGAVDASLRSGWLRRLVSDEALRFLERPRWAIARDKSHEEWLPAERRRILDEALSILEGVAAEAPGGLSDPLLQELHLALARAADADGVPFNRVAAVRSGLASSLRLRLASDDTGYLAAAQDTESLVIGHDTDPGMASLAVESALSLRGALGNALRTGAVPTIAAAKLAIDRAERIRSRRPDLAARTQASWARVNRVRFDPERLAVATEALREAQALLSQAPAADAMTRAEVLHAEAMMAKTRGDNASGAARSEQRLGLLERACGPLDRRTMGALLNTAFYWTRVDVARAVALKEELLARRMRVWGDSTRPEVAEAQKELAFSLVHLWEQDRLTEAHELASSAMASLSVARGAHHKSTQMARGVSCHVSCRLSDGLEADGNVSAAEDLRWAARAAAEENVAQTPSDARPQTVLGRRRRLAECLVRLGDEQGIEILREVLDRQLSGVSQPDDETDAGSEGAPFEDIEVLWTVAELAAGLHRLGQPDRADELAAQYPIVRDERWPESQPRGWRSTRPKDARAGVL